MSRLSTTLSNNKSREIFAKLNSLWNIFDMAEKGASRQIGGAVPEGIARDFIREFLPIGFRLKNGLIFDENSNELSPQIDGIVYHGVPLLEYTDVVVVEKKKVKGALEIKSWISQPDIFGKKTTKGRDIDSGLITEYKRRKKYLPAASPYILFVFSLSSSTSDVEVSNRLKQICDMYAIVSRRLPSKMHSQEEREYNFDDSISHLIDWLKSLKFD